jgi:hypothetical protein
MNPMGHGLRFCVGIGSILVCACGSSDTDGDGGTTVPGNATIVFTIHLTEPVTPRTCPSEAMGDGFWAGSIENPLANGEGGSDVECKIFDGATYTGAVLSRQPDPPGVFSFEIDSASEVIEFSSPSTGLLSGVCVRRLGSVDNATAQSTFECLELVSSVDATIGCSAEGQFVFASCDR